MNKYIAKEVCLNMSTGRLKHNWGSYISRTSTAI